MENKDLVKFFTPVIKGYYVSKTLVQGIQKYCFNFLLRAKNLEKSEINNLIEENNDNQEKENKNEIKGSEDQKSLNDLIFEILKNMLNTEIKSKKIKLIPHKSFKYDFFSSLNNSQSNLSASAGSTGNNANKELSLLKHIFLQNKSLSLSKY